MVKRFGISRGCQPAGDVRPGRGDREEGRGTRLRSTLVHRPSARHEGRLCGDEHFGDWRPRRSRSVARSPTFAPRHPTVTANATTALDELSDGRALLGLGAGWVAVHSIGEKPNRIAELRESIALFRRLFAGEEVDFSGTKGRLATARRQIPIYLAVSQPRMLELAGEDLRRRRPDGSGRSRLLQLADRAHPPRSAERWAQTRGHPRSISSSP